MPGKDSYTGIKPLALASDHGHYMTARGWPLHTCYIMCTCVYTHACMYIYIHTRVCAHAHACTHTCVCTCTYIYMYIYIYTCVHVCVYMYVYTHACIYMTHHDRCGLATVTILKRFRNGGFRIETATWVQKPGAV